MKKWLDLADQYIQESDWKMIALLKFCLLSLGMIVGLQVPKEKRKPVMTVCAIVFIASYIPLIVKLVRLMLREREAEC